MTATHAGLAAGIHTRGGETAARRLAEGFTFASIASDLAHLDQASRTRAQLSRFPQPCPPLPVSPL